MKFIMTIIFILFLFLQYSHHQSAAGMTEQDRIDIQMETRARAIASGLYYGE